ncbi:MAG TPA: DEAD/DEAH box helicase [Thermoanaerobaculia bacterium]|nr:DEAD/DEAH box helicase [Thermoanaerobaculia bacterium]
MSFSNLGLGPKLLKTLESIGFSTPTPIQTSAIPTVLTGSDLIGIAQTGTGKTAAFALPMLERLAANRAAASRAPRHPRALILAPTRELAAQIEESFRIFGKSLDIRSTVIFGGVAEGPQIQAVRHGVDIIVATPGRLLDLMGQKRVSLRGVEIAVLDEADRMLDMGFLPSIRKIVATLPKERQTLLFSATLSKDIEKVTAEFLRAPKLIEIGRRSSPVESVTQILVPVDKGRKIDLLVHVLNDPALDSVLVFSRTKHGADKIARKLASARISSATIHGNRSQGQRTRALAAFKGGEVQVLVATDIAARGIDIEEISHVINFDFPMHPEDYVHRIGRTGRAAATGDAISFVTAEDEPSVRDLEKLTGRKVERRIVKGFEPSSAGLVLPAGARIPGRRPQQVTSSRPAVRHDSQRRTTSAPHRSSRPRPAAHAQPSGPRRRSESQSRNR